jgi:co-chaperonin GroES (HSP10)
MNEQTVERTKIEPKRANDWDKFFLNGVDAVGPWILVVTEGTPEMSSGGILVPRSGKEMFSRVVSVGADVKTVPVKVGDRVIYREGFNAMPKEHETLPKNTFTLVFEPNILAIIRNGVEIPSIL